MRNLCAAIASATILLPSAVAFQLLVHRSTSHLDTYVALRLPNVFDTEAYSNVQLQAKKGKVSDTDIGSNSKVLISEAIAPWRSLRLFFYFASGSGAFVGGLITLSRVLAAISGARSDMDLNTEYTNLAIDFGAAIAFGIFAKIDSDKGAELNAKVEQKLEKRKQNENILQEMKRREKALQKLELNVRISQDGTVQCAPVEAIQKGAKQHIIIVVGSQKAIRDALLGANILKMDFALRDVLVVPYELNKRKEEDLMRPDGSGFGNTSRPSWETQPYIARVAGGGWDSWIEAEMADAVKQNGEKVRTEGIAIVVANSGKIIRRGVGQVPWRDMVMELENAVKEEPLPDFGFLSGN